MLCYIVCYKFTTALEKPAASIYRVQEQRQQVSPQNLTSTLLDCIVTSAIRRPPSHPATQRSGGPQMERILKFLVETPLGFLIAGWPPTSHLCYWLWHIQIMTMRTLNLTELAWIICAQCSIQLRMLLANIFGIQSSWSLARFLHISEKWILICISGIQSGKTSSFYTWRSKQ